MSRFNPLWPTEPDDSNSDPPYRDIVEDIVASDLNAKRQTFFNQQDRMGSNTYGGGVAGSDFFAYQHPSGGLRLRVNPGNLYTGLTDPVWVAQQDSSTLTAPVTNPRIDVLVIDNAAGTVSWVAGSEGASPAIPTVGLDKTPLWAVYLRVGATTIDRQGYDTGTNSYLYRDMRPGQGYRPVPPFRFPGEISPASFGANQDNYNPTGLAAASVLRLTATGASRDITGIAGGGLGRVLVLMNIGSQNIVLKDASGSSTAANRFEFPSGDVTILPEGVAIVEYDNTSTRWRLASASSLAPSGSAGGDLSGTYPNPAVAQASAAFAFTGDISPSQITSNQNDYAPTGHATAGVFRLSSDASRNITGLAGGADGRLVFLANVGAQNIVLKDDDAASTAGNRFALTADITLSPDSLVVLLYDSTSSRWRAVAGGGGSGGVAAADFDAKGDLLVGSANDAYDNLAVGTNGQILEADSAQTLGLKWGSKEGGASAFRFHDDDLTASGTSVAMNIPGDTGLTEIVMPYAGSIVAVSVACQNARTAGTATFKPTINGTESSGLSAVLNGTNTQYAYGTQAAGTDVFTAGQRIGVKVTTDGSWAAGTTPSVDVEVFIVPSTSAPTLPTLGSASVTRTSGSVTTTSGTLADVTGMSVTITTTGGPVLLILAADVTHSTSTTSTWFDFRRDGTTYLSSGTSTSLVNGLATFRADTNNGLAHLSLVHIDPVAAGTYTYQLRWATGGATATFLADGTNRSARLWAREMPVKGVTG